MQFVIEHLEKRYEKKEVLRDASFAFDSGKIYNRTKGTEFQGQPFPEFMQKLIAAGGLVNYTNSK